MKKKCEMSHFLRRNDLLKIWMIMKFTFIFLMVFVVQLSASVYSPAYAQPAKLKVEFKEATIKEVIDEIEKQTDLTFFFSGDVLNTSQTITLKARNMSVDEILDLVSEQTGLSITIVRDQILVKKNLPAKAVLFQQQKTVSGKVTDSGGQPLPGVTVVLKGTTQGTVTNANGEYSITDIPEDAALVFSFVGMVTQEITVGNKTTINVGLIADAIGIEEVVAIGYGTKKRVNLTGSVTTIQTEELGMTPTPDLSQSIMGKSPGLFIKNSSGQPGDRTATAFNIRGWGAPLIIIDGMESTSDVFNALPADQVESFSVLKDAAAAAVYGARAGNGVILVTTKRGKTGMDITLTSNYGLQFFADPPEFVNSAQMAQMENLAYQNMGDEPKWTNEEIQKFIDGNDPHYPNTNWWKETFRSFAPQTQHNLSIQGGSDKVKYFVSGNYYYQEALARANETKLNRYSLRSNIDISITDKMNLGFDLSTSYTDYMSPANEMEYYYHTRKEQRGIMIWIYRARAYWPVKWPDESKVVRRSPLDYSYIENVGYRNEKIQNSTAKLSLSYDLPFDIKAKASLFVDRYDFREKFKVSSVPMWDYDWATDTYTILTYTASSASLEESLNQTSSFTGNFSLNWQKQIDDHNISALAVYEYYNHNYNFFSASRMRYEQDLDYLDYGPALDQSNSGDGGYGGRVGLVSRVNYDYRGKYYFEMNGRYDASPRFPKNTRWGFFPSASLAWRISEEDFIKDNLSMITNLKLRGSYGKLGNDQIGDYQYLSTYSMSGNYIFDSSTNDYLSGIKSDAMPNIFITWEKMTTSNIALDFSLWNSKLEGAFDVFYRLRSDVLGRRSINIPNVVGAVLPNENYAEYDSRGFEISLNTHNKIGSVNYIIGGNLSWNRSKTRLIDQAEFGNADLARTGDIVGQWTDLRWGYKSDGLFQSQEEIDNWAIQDGKNNASVIPGDVRIVDMNNDGIINSYDRTTIGRGTGMPMLNFGINMNLTWKGFGFYMLWQGAGLNYVNLRHNGDFGPFLGNNTPFKYMYYESYTPENEWIPANTTGANYPIYGLQTWNQSRPYTYSPASDFWLRKADYIRLKNVRLSYSLDKKITEYIGLGSWDFYLSGTNLITFSHLKGMLDPEVNTGSDTQYSFAYHPPVGTYNIGMVIKF